MAGATATESTPATTLAGRVALRAWPVGVQWLRFATVGVSNTILSLALYAGLLRLGTFYLAASAVAFVVATLNSYALNRRWTFRSNGRRGPEVVRFYVVSAGGLALDLGLLYVLVDHARVPSFAAQLVVIPFVSVVTFAWNRRWTFAAASPPPLRDDRDDEDGHDVGHLDHRVDRRPRRVLERVAHGVAGDRGGVGL
jgi:putative flippase GtrA